jgi:hypothetical protein
LKLLCSVSPLLKVLVK